MLLFMLTIAPSAVVGILLIFTALTALVVKAVSDFGVDIRGFFVYSTIFNAALVLGFVAASVVTSL